MGIFSDDFLALGGLSNAVLMTTCLITGERVDISFSIKNTMNTY